MDGVRPLQASKGVTGMTQAEKIAMVQTLVENDAEATATVVPVYLTLALNTMLERLFPYDSTKDSSDDLPVGTHRYPHPEDDYWYH